MADTYLFANKAKSCFSWTPQQMAEAFCADIASGEIKPESAIIVFTELSPDGKSRDIRTWRSQMEWAEEYAYLGIAQEKSVNRV